MKQYRLIEARLGLTYFIAENVANPHLRDLGFVVGKRVSVISKTETNAIVIVAGTRLALDSEILADIWVKEEQETEDLLELSSLKPGETGIVRHILTDTATKRRLMDMGITRGVSVYVRKLAPLGDPMELHLRGYSLSLRKLDASKIQVVKEEKA